MTTIAINRREAEYEDNALTLYRVSPKGRSRVVRRKIEHANVIVATWVVARWLVWGSVPR